jgi:hypothetical protein
MVLALDPRDEDRHCTPDSNILDLNATHCLEFLVIDKAVHKKLIPLMVGV